jgi:hypothetical protein
VSAIFEAGLDRLRAADVPGAEACFRASIQENPEHAPSYSNLAMVCGRQGDKQVALSLSRIAHRLDPKNPMIVVNLAVALWRLERYADSVTWTRHALSLDPDPITAAHAWHNMGATHSAQGRAHEAVYAYEKALSLDPDREETKWDLAWALLGAGYMARGLEMYEMRWKWLPKGPIWDSGIPEWQGEDLVGKTIVVHHEQGYGDTLLFVRYAMQLRHHYQGVRVVLAVPPALARLCQRLTGIDEIAIAEANTPWRAGDAYQPKIDFHSPVISVMRWLDPNGSVTSDPYIPAPPVPGWFDPDPKQFNIGVVWSAAQTGQRGSELKTIDPRLLLPLAEIPGVVLHGLQKGDSREDLDWTGMGALIRDHSPRINDFYDLAGMMTVLDLTISVDTAPLHLAGAIGVPVVGLIPYARCWRWPRGDTHYTGWYGQMHLEAQPKPGDWETPISRVADLVQGMMDGRRRVVPLRHRADPSDAAGSGSSMGGGDVAAVAPLQPASGQRDDFPPPPAG